MLLWRSVLFVFFVSVGIIPSLFLQNYKSNIDDSVMIKFDFTVESGSLATMTFDDRATKQRWQQSIKEAVSILPGQFVRGITEIKCNNLGYSRSFSFGPGIICTNTLRFHFFIDDKSWITGYPGEINLRSSETNIPKWMVWEPFPKDGYSKEERLWVAFHEMAHSYDMSVKNYSAEFEEMSESPTTLYGCIGGSVEDFGDAFSLFVMFPEQLKKFPDHYRVVKKILNREYATSYIMPNSVKSKLTDPKIGCGQG